MAPSTLVQTANGPTLKRSFPAAAIANPPSQERGALLETGRRIDGQQVQAQAPKRRQSRDNRFTNMPSAAGPRNYENHIPSFMSVYDMDANMTDSSAAGGSGMKFAGTTSYSTPQSNAPIPQHQTQQTQEVHDKSLAQSPTHQSRESTSTQASDSTDSSPTTTISTVDSCSLSDPSPSSSPESPITLVPLSSFASTAFSLDQFSNLKMADNSTTTTIRPPASDERPMTSPSPRRWKNPKSLALNLNSGSDSYSQTSEPSSPSPSFIKPPTPMARRKPSLLSLNTGAANQNFLAAPLAPLGNLASPGLHARRSLKHSMSSPQIISTPSFGPKGGMTFGDRGVSRLGMGSVIHEDSPLEGPGVQMATRVAGVDVGGDEFDRRRFVENDDSDGYPDGPILMQEPSVHLYSEPKLEEAMKFDVIFNVAREVRNPFAAAEERRESTKSEPTMTPSTALSSFSFKTAFEFQPSGYDSTPETPTTPKAMDHRPEYIHLPWDHNTNITDQLWDLCEKIDARVKEGKKVLVHCQQGASRSATLIIAYIMYKNPDWTQDRARDEAKARSQWVNPNMSLLFCLNDFKKIVDEKKGEKKDVVKPLGHRPTLSADSTLNVDAPPTPSRARGNSTPSAPTPDRQTRPTVEEAPASDSKTIRTLNSFDFGFSAIPSIPKRDVDDWESSALMSPRVTEMTSNPLQQAFNFSRPLAPAIFEEPPTPGLFSPRTTEFPRSAFFHSPIASPPPVEDPRSPPTKGEAPIIRSIDDLL